MNRVREAACCRIKDCPLAHRHAKVKFMALPIWRRSAFVGSRNYFRGNWPIGTSTRKNPGTVKPGSFLWVEKDRLVCFFAPEKIGRIDNSQTWPRDDDRSVSGAVR
jgi:hypothetical protein